ncbi:MAG: GlsB/YeaQ/YmgE family stress response membrane protein [Pseudomonadota bacterium]
MRINLPIEPLIGFLLIGLVAGFLAERIIRGRGAGLVINLVVGVVGALIGGFLFGFLNVSFHGLIGPLISAALGAAVLLLLLGLVKTVRVPQKSGWSGWKNWSRALGHRR